MRPLSLAVGWLLAAHAVVRAVRARRIERKVILRLDGREIAREVNRITRGSA
jgi:hypothetical protein